jgi:hypothetical protein
MWLDSAQENLKAVGVRNWRQVAGLKPMATNHKRGQSSLWSVTPAEEEAILLHNFVAILVFHGFAQSLKINYWFSSLE